MLGNRDPIGTSAPGAAPPEASSWRLRSAGIAGIAGGLALVAGIAMRVWNAFAYKHLFGFDAQFNWQYIVYLTRTWELPHPDSMWSAAHPPLFYYLSAAVIRALGDPDAEAGVIVLRLIGTAFGLGGIALAFVLVRRFSPRGSRRPLLAAGLLLFLPVHVYMSAMLSEEVLVSFLISSVLVGAALRSREPAARREAAWIPLCLGALAGLAWLTKLTGILVALAVVASFLIQGWREEALPAAARRVALFIVAVAVIGGWFYLRNLVSYGYLYPSDLSVHQVMYTMQPGERFIGDYFYLPLAIWTDPQVLNHDLVRSVWGSTYVTMWFDGHRFFLPHSVPRVDCVGGAILALALLPMAAFAIGVARGFRRATALRSSADVLLLLTLALTLAGYVLFTWRNPFFAVCKASFLLSLGVPFAFYTSEVIGDWWRRGGAVATGVASVLVVGALIVTATFTQTRLFWNMDHMDRPGMVWATWDPRTGTIHHR